MGDLTGQLVHLITRPFSGEGVEPNFLICGAPRSGTTTLAELMGEHPEIYLCPIKEPQYFTAYFNNPASWYKRQFAPPEKAKAVGEASTNYIHREEAASRIHDFNSDMKLIFILRDPIQRAYSHYKREIQTHGVTDKFLDLLKESDHYTRPGLYHTHISRFRSYFPEDQILLLLFEDFVDRPEAVLNRVREFLELDPEFPNIDSSKQANPSRVPRSRKTQKLIYSLLGQADGEPVSVRYLKGGLRLLLTKLNRRKGDESGFSPLSSEEKDFLKNIYSPEVEKINQFVEKDVREYWDFEF